MPLITLETDRIVSDESEVVVNGYVYFGVYGENPKIEANRIVIYSDEAMQIAAENPQRTDSFGRRPDVYTNEDHSYAVYLSDDATLIEGPKNRRANQGSSGAGGTIATCKTVADATSASGPMLTSGSVMTAAQVAAVADTGATLDTTMNNTTSQKGGGTYEIKSRAQHRTDIGNPTWVPDGYGDHYLLGGTTYVMVLIVDDHINALQFGAINASGNDSASIAACIARANSSNGKVYFPQGAYVLADPIPFYSCSLVGESQRGVSIACNALTSQFVLQETWQYAECKNIRFNGTGVAKCFDGETTGKGFFGLNIENCRFTSFTRAFEKYASLFCIYNNVQFRFCGRGLNFNAGSGTYHNVNQLIGCYFDEADEYGVYFDSASNGSSLSIINTAFDHCAVGVYAGRPVELLGECYFERDAVGIHAVNTNITHGRLYMLGQASGGTDIGIHLDNSTLIQLGIASFADSFGGGKVLAENGSLILNVAGTSQNGYTLNDTSRVLDYEELLTLVSVSVPDGPEVETIVNLSTTPVDVGSGRFSSSSQFTAKIQTASGSKCSFQFGLMLNNDLTTWRAEAFSVTVPTFTRLDANNWTIEGLGDSRTYTFNVNGASGQMSIVADAATTGNTIITVQGLDNIPV